MAFRFIVPDFGSVRRHAKPVDLRDLNCTHTPRLETWLPEIRQWSPGPSSTLDITVYVSKASRHSISLMESDRYGAGFVEGSRGQRATTGAADLLANGPHDSCE